MVCTKVPSRKGKRRFLGIGAFVAFGALSLSFLVPSLSFSAKETLAGGPQEELVNSDSLAFQVTTSAATSTSHSFQCAVSSTKIEAVANSSRYQNVFVVPDDDAFPATIDEAKESAENLKRATEEAGETYVPIRYNATVYNIFNSNSNKDIVIPETIAYIDLFVFDITSVNAEVCKDHDADKISYKNINTITIPKTIAYVEKDAFIGAAEAGVTINVEAEDDSHFDPEWTDTDNVVFDFDTSPYASRLNVQAATTIRTFGQGKDYIVGIKNAQYDYPLVAEYDLLDANNNKVGDTKRIELPITSTNTDYDAVGSNVGSSSLNFVVDIPVQEGYHVDDQSITFHNIYPALRVDNPSGTGKITIPDVENGPLYALPRLSFEQTATFETLFKSHPGSLCSFGGFTKVGLIVTRQMDAYKELLPRAYNTYEKQIQSGDYSIRHQFTSLGQASYRIVYRHNGALVDKTIRVVTPITNAIISATGEYEVGFLIENSAVGEGFDSSSLVEIDLQAFSIKIDLLNNEKNSKVNKSDLTIRFSSMILLKEGEVAPSAKLDIGLITGLTFLIYAVVYTAIALAYFFYAKNKFKNDEFRRVNPKKFAKEAVKNGVGIGLIVGAIFFIIARWGMFNSTVVVFNPLDVFVIVFVIAGAIYAGFAIKNIVTSIKNNRKRKEAARLHLDEDKDEDGTN